MGHQSTPSARALRPAVQTHSKRETRKARTASLGVLVVDLNNFASFPTLAVGLIISRLRAEGLRAELLSPLAYDIPAVQRERREGFVDHVMRRVHLSDAPGSRNVRNLLRRARETSNERPRRSMLREIDTALDRGPDAVLLSAYLQHYEMVRAIAERAKARNIPVLLGGPMFNVPEVAASWRDLPGITAIVGAEVDLSIADMVRAMCEGRPLTSFPGVLASDGKMSAPARPLRGLDATPIPDFTDFPWDRYPVRIVPVMTGRGCQWDKCLFCSDVISASGRTFRTRSVETVLLEMQEQARRHETTNFLFLDLKLNSWPDMIRGIAANIDRYVQGAEWIGTVHVDQRKDNGLSRADLETAVAGGMRRVSFGLETGSQRLLDAMRKGASVERNAQFIRDAHAAGLSIRCTMFKGFPGETAEDMAATADFLEQHADCIDRVRFNDFTLGTGTPIWKAMQDKADSPLEVTERRDRRARAEYRFRTTPDRAYRRAKARALSTVYAINSRQLRDSARQFDGLM